MQFETPYSAVGDAVVSQIIVHGWGSADLRVISLDARTHIELAFTTNDRRILATCTMEP